MYNMLKGPVLKMLKVPPEPDPPAGHNLKVFLAAPGFFKYRLIGWMIGMGAFGLGAGGATAGALGLSLELSGESGAAPVTGLVWALVALIWVLYFSMVTFSYITLKLDYEMRWYKVTDRSLRIREGVVHVREMTMTFANIQNISISQGPLQRLFGVQDLKVETAGGGGVPAGQEQQGFSLHVGFFRGVDNAEEIRDMMMERLRRLRDAGLGDTDDDHHEDDIAPQSGDDVAVLRDILAEARAMRAAAEARAGST